MTKIFPLTLSFFLGQSGSVKFTEKSGDIRVAAILLSCSCLVNSSIVPSLLKTDFSLAVSDSSTSDFSANKFKPLVFLQACQTLEWSQHFVFSDWDGPNLADKFLDRLTPPRSRYGVTSIKHIAFINNYCGTLERRKLFDILGQNFKHIESLHIFLGEDDQNDGQENDDDENDDDDDESSHAETLEIYKQVGEKTMRVISFAGYNEEKALNVSLLPAFSLTLERLLLKCCVIADDDLATGLSALRKLHTLELDQVMELTGSFLTLACSEEDGSFLPVSLKILSIIECNHFNKFDGIEYLHNLEELSFEDLTALTLFTPIPLTSSEKNEDAATSSFSEAAAVFPHRLRKLVVRMYRIPPQPVVAILEACRPHNALQDLQLTATTFTGSEIETVFGNNNSETTSNSRCWSSLRELKLNMIPLSSAGFQSIVNLENLGYFAYVARNVAALQQPVEQLHNGIVPTDLASHHGNNTPTPTPLRKFCYQGFGLSQLSPLLTGSSTTRFHHIQTLILHNTAVEIEDIGGLNVIKDTLTDLTLSQFSVQDNRIAENSAGLLSLKNLTKLFFMFDAIPAPHGMSNPVEYGRKRDKLMSTLVCQNKKLREVKFLNVSELTDESVTAIADAGLNSLEQCGFNTCLSLTANSIPSCRRLKQLPLMPYLTVYGTPALMNVTF